MASGVWRHDETRDFFVCAFGLGLREHGVSVTRYNVSHEQVIYARERAAREGLTGRVTFVEDDYRSTTGHFDAFVSVGMLEHVERRRFHELSHELRRTLRRDTGRGLLHFIGRDSPRPLNAWIRRRIFPGAYSPTLTEVTADMLTPSGMSVLDVENLRLHYARTLAQLESAVWSRRGPGTHGVWRTLPARLGAVPRRLRDVIRHGVATAVPGRLRTGGIDTPPSGRAQSFTRKDSGAQ